VNSIQKLENRVNRDIGEYGLILTQIKMLTDENIQLEKSKEAGEKARSIIQEVAQTTQQQLEYHLSSVTSMAMEYVFDDPYELSVAFTQRRNKTEVDVLFRKGEELVNPITACGGGAVDIAALSLQISILLMSKNTNRILFLDEPLKWLKGKDYPERGAEILKEISSKLGIQILMVSHDPTLIANADTVFSTEKKKKKIK
jgi:DNA repair exonuclease SbcCD ATPase subunit